MDYYTRKARAQRMIKLLADQDRIIEDIKFIIEDTYQMSPSWIQKFYEAYQLTKETIKENKPKKK